MTRTEQRQTAIELAALATFNRRLHVELESPEEEIHRLLAGENATLKLADALGVLRPGDEARIEREADAMLERWHEIAARAPRAVVQTPADMQAMARMRRESRNP